VFRGREREGEANASPHDWLRFGILSHVRMIWLFLILACSGGAVLWAGIAAYLRVRRHLKITAELRKSGVHREVDSL